MGAPSTSAGEGGGLLTRSFRLVNEGGLHARPAVKLAMLAKSFRSRIELSAGEEGRWVDAKSVVRIMGLKGAQGAVFHLRAKGADSQAALLAIAALAERAFDESAEHADSAGDIGP